MKIKTLIFLIILYLLSDYNGLGQKIPVIPLGKAYEKQEKITTKEFVQSFTYVALETSPECLIGANPRIDLTEDHIIITDQFQCLIFDKTSGSFVRQIGHVGRDPGGFRSTRGFFNYNTKMFYFLGWNNNLIKYSIEGKYISSIKVPEMNNSLTNGYSPEKFTYLSDRLFVCNVLNTNGLQSVLLLEFDEDGKEIKTIPNQAILKEHPLTVTTGELNFFHNNHELLYNEIFNDTIFRLGTDKATPYLVYARGKYRITRESQWLAVEQMRPGLFLESEKFMFFTFSVFKTKQYFALYNKTNSSLKVCEIDKGVINDTNGFLPFSPSVLFNDELAGLIQPLDILKWVEDNKKTESSSELERITSIEATGNPVVVFAKLQK